MMTVSRSSELGTPLVSRGCSMVSMRVDAGFDEGVFLCADPLFELRLLDAGRALGVLDGIAIRCRGVDENARGLWRAGVSGCDRHAARYLRNSDDSGEGGERKAHPSRITSPRRPLNEVGMKLR